jgi:hypothetical protein
VLFHQYFTGELPKFEEQQFCCHQHCQKHGNESCTA